MAAQAVEGIYSTATGAGTSYQKAENYAHDAVLLILSVGAIVGSAVELAKNVENLQSVLNTLEGRKDRFDTDEFIHSANTSPVEKIYCFDDFVACMKEYLDTDSLQYIKQELGKDSDNLQFLNKIVEVVQSANNIKNGQLELFETKFIVNALADGYSKENILEVVYCLRGTLDVKFLDEEALEYLLEIAKSGEHDLFKIIKSIQEAFKEKKAILNKKDVKYLVRAVFDEVPQEQISELIRDGVDDNFIIFNDTYKNSLPKPKKADKMGGALQAHHALQQKWATENLAKYGYDKDLAPTVTIETRNGYPHTKINNLQNARQRKRIAEGKGEWSSTLQEELSYIVSDFRAAGFSDVTIGKVLEQQYKMLDKLGVPYERVKINEYIK